MNRWPLHTTWLECYVSCCLVVLGFAHYTITCRQGKHTTQCFTWRDPCQCCLSCDFHCFIWWKCKGNIAWDTGANIKLVKICIAIFILCTGRNYLLFVFIFAFLNNHLYMKCQIISHRILYKQYCFSLLCILSIFCPHPPTQIDGWFVN